MNVLGNFPPLQQRKRGWQKEYNPETEETETAQTGRERRGK